MLCREFGANLHLAPLAYCSDNAAMIGRCAIDGYERGDFTEYEKLISNPRSAL